MTIQIRDEVAKDLSLYLKRITYDDAYLRTDCGFTKESRKAQAYKFLDGVSDVEKSLNKEKRNIEIRDEKAKPLSLYLKRITYEDAYRRTDSGVTEESRKAQAYKFLDGVSNLEKSLNEELSRQSLNKNKEQAQGIRR
jgi:hypothetical protein